MGYINLLIMAKRRKSEKGYCAGKRNADRERPSTAQEKHLQNLTILLVFIIVGIALLWTWIKAHIWQSVLGCIIIVGLFVLALWKLPKFREFVCGEFWMKLWKLLKPPAESYKGRKILEGKNTEVPQLNQSEKNNLMDKVGNKCEYCRDLYTLDVHHILPRSEGGSNKQSNLIVLCSKCHRMAHGGGISKARLQGIARKR